MPELPPIRSFNLKVIFLTHFIFTSLSTMGHWNSLAYLFYNSLLIFLLVWSIYHDQSHEPIQLAIVVNGCSIILDILLLILDFPTGQNESGNNKFSAAMAVLHLIIRPFSTILLIRNLEERSGSPGVLTGILSRGNESYEDIDSNRVPQSSSTGGYDFNNAQQI
ncbi:unnamed protein product [Phaedon cochleariae]|uniref:Type-1 angiotensin II receptor-associated protein n=1 Tax=Phaedon cochleariae TaxID=80249 RepID=A0A9P0DBM9_PHACE|nr:unnamed protein product [Phaedon cochleariae]